MKTQMKKIGVVGFTPATTIVYYREIVKRFPETFDPQMFPEMTLDILNLHKVHHSATDGHFDIFIDYICHSLENLKKAGADFGVIASNTPHMFFKEIQARVELPLVNLVTATFDVIAKTKLKNIGLIGTRPTMELDFYKIPFQNIGMKVHVPLLEDDREFLKIIILKELSKEIFKDETISRVNHIIEKMKEEQHIDGIILGCTEFPLFVKEEKIGIPAFDTIDIHVDAIINFMKTN